MVVPGSAPIIQQDHALEPDLGRGSTENSAMEPETESGIEEVHPELEEVRKLQELVKRLEIQNQQLRSRSRRSLLGTNTQTNTGVDNHNPGLNGMEINNSINTITEKQELQIMADVHGKLCKIKTEVEEGDCLKKDVDTQVHYACHSITEKISPNSKHINNIEMQDDDVHVHCSSGLDGSSCTELVQDLITKGVHPSVKMSEHNPKEESGDLESFLNDTGLDEVEVLELGNCSDEEDSWLYVSPRKSTADHKTESPLKWCRQVLDNPSPETEVACRTLINRLDQAGRWKNLYCSPLASPSAHNLNTETSSCSNALNSPGHLKSTNKPLLTCGSSGYLSMHSALSSQSSVDSELSTSDDSISMGYKLQDLTDVQVMARLQEESLRQDFASSSASVSRRSSSASLHSLRRGTYSDQEFDTYSLEDEDEYDCSLSYRSAHRYSPSPLSSPRCQSPSGADYSRTTTSRIRPPRRAGQSPMQDQLKYTNNEEEMRHSMPNLARTSLRSLESVRSSRSLESDLQVPSSRLSRIQQPSTSLAPNKFRYSSGAGQSPLTVRQPMKAGSCTNSLLTPRQPVKTSGYTNPTSGIRKPQSSTLCPGPSSGSSSTTRSNSMATGAKNSPVKVRTSVGGTSTPKSKLTQTTKRFPQSTKTSQTTADDSWKDGCY
uniref:SLAIN motif-containing protein-like n=1 Tax=Pelusios castaneus TaxID=367368 RepID=A0A8C8SWK7_9SAUR